MTSCPMPDCECHEAMRAVEGLRKALDRMLATFGYRVCRECGGHGSYAQRNELGNYQDTFCSDCSGLGVETCAKEDLP